MTTPAFLDETRIWVKGGDGGAGCTSFRREKYVPHGGPDGGDGGNGGNVYLVGKAGLSSLHHFRRQRHFRAERGQHGSGSNKTGRSGEHTYVEVPLGTLVRDEEGNLIGEVLQPGQKTLVASGARGGKGNAYFKSSTNRAPREFGPGEYGEERWLFLELKLLADVAIIGFPNAGKSTLISRISAARPKIADYPFTTLVPNLGVVEAPGLNSFVVADVPGLIEGASEGKGMGTQFLRHVERSRILLHLLDGAALDPEDPAKAYRAVRHELESYSPELAVKFEIVALNKADIGLDEEMLAQLRAEVGNLLVISSVSGEGVQALVLEMWKALCLHREEDAKRETQTPLGRGVKKARSGSDSDSDDSEEYEWAEEEWDEEPTPPKAVKKATRRPESKSDAEPQPDVESGPDEESEDDAQQYEWVEEEWDVEPHYTGDEDDEESDDEDSEDESDDEESEDESDDEDFEDSEDESDDEDFEDSEDGDEDSEDGEDREGSSGLPGKPAGRS